MQIQGCRAEEEIQVTLWGALSQMWVLLKTGLVSSGHFREQHGLFLRSMFYLSARRLLEVGTVQVEESR